MITEKEKQCRNVLDILSTAGDMGLEENQLKQEMEIKNMSPMSTNEANAIILFCLDKGWIAKRVDEFDNDRIFITTSGKNRRSTTR